MRKMPPQREFAFLIHDVARMMKTCADHAARPCGITRAQWAVLAKVERSEGLKQSELADMLDIQPITLTRLIDRLCEAGLLERRPDPDDRRAKRLYLLPAAKPLLDRMWIIGNELMATICAGVDDADLTRTIGQLALVRDNLRQLIERRTSAPAGEQRLHA
jgi:MarR family transcriptional regulator, transcriptional regulator for hemolysin